VAQLVLVRRIARKVNAIVDAEQVITPGDKGYVDSASPSTAFAVFFEDDGDTGYFYAVERSGSDIKIFDALQVYVVAVEGAQSCQLQIVWSRDGLKSALLIDNVAQAVIDFSARRGYCRRGEGVAKPPWNQDHQWSDAAAALFV